LALELCPHFATALPHAPLTILQSWKYSVLIPPGRRAIEGRGN
jgi:hypothetical protein